jgi:hypothetical protein
MMTVVSENKIKFVLDYVLVFVPTTPVHEGLKTAEVFAVVQYT